MTEEFFYQNILGLISASNAVCGGALFDTIEHIFSHPVDIKEIVSRDKQFSIRVCFVCHSSDIKAVNRQLNRNQARIY